MTKNIVLTGYRGTGKTSVAKALSQKLKLKIVSTDREMEKKEGLEIADIVKQKGWDYFRNLESGVVKDISEFNNCVIDTGGGVVLREENMNNLRMNGTVFLLTSPEKVIIERLKKDNGTKGQRPAIKGKNPYDEIGEILRERKKYYDDNDFSIDTSKHTVEEVAGIISMLMKPKIGIIGGTGQMGQWFKKIFEKEGYKVLVSGRKTKLTNTELAKQCDVIIVSVPISKTSDVINEVAPFVKENALLTDFTSIKVEPVREMLKSDSEVIGMHPMFGPGVNSLEGQTVVLCPVRSKLWTGWLKKFLKDNGARIKISTPEEHDNMMAVVQGITHFNTISSGISMKDMDFDLEKSREYTSPVYKLELTVIGRIFAQSAELYADILTRNPEIVRAIEAHSKSMNKLMECIKKKDRKEIIRMFNETADYFGSFKKEALEDSKKIIEHMSK